jgi:hypothetical protein
MNGKMLFLTLSVLVSSSSFTFTDSLWIVGAEGYAGDLVTVEVWLQYEGGGVTDSIAGFDIPLTWDASVCTVEAITFGPDFREHRWPWICNYRIDNHGTDGPPAIAKVGLTAYSSTVPFGELNVERGTHLAATLDVRILGSAVRGDSACFDTLMRAFTPTIYLEFVDKNGIIGYVPSFSTGCVRVLSYTDSVWIVSREGVPGGLVPIQVWLQYEGGGPGDSISSFDIPLTWNADVCTVEAITIGPDFIDGTFPDWLNTSSFDNTGTQGPPAVPKLGISAWNYHPTFVPPPVPRGSHLAGTIDFRILNIAEPSESTCIDTLGAWGWHVLGFLDGHGIYWYVPSFSGGCIHVIPCSCGDVNGDGRVTVADAIYISTYIYKGGEDPICEGDVNQDGRITSADAIYLLTYIYRNGPEPCNPP